MTLFHFNYLFLSENVRNRSRTPFSQVLCNLVGSKAVNFGQKWPKMAKYRVNHMLFKIDSEENEKRNANSILIFGFTMKFYITYLPVFETPLALHLQL